ncbi:hypothetical protein [Flavobacterium orientale]|uniref:Uncharacterized protein n=1 Tax=Flavobacterium orientale TaxID=1756020 RepID=A0A916XUZ6_9FLAO|nr:hypothetical protein [Flavobacterium orientale]GGD14374.1 hypothetical protein GCM10011343_01810 [Flavobacterium orientale]
MKQSMKHHDLKIISIQNSIIDEKNKAFELIIENNKANTSDTIVNDMFSSIQLKLELLHALSNK